MNITQTILTLDKKRCRVYGCGCTSNLEVHHIIPRSQGGPNKDWNLITLCSKHHRLITENKLTDIVLLTALLRKKDFRWKKALEWHLKRAELAEVLLESKKTNRDISESDS